MYCKHHSHTSGVNTCSICGEWLCEECSVDINGRIVCKSCIAHRMYDAPATAASHTPSSPRHYSAFLMLICSCMPSGVNYMYLGLIKRGLFFLTVFFGIIFAAAVTNLGQICILLPVLWLACVFDGFEKRRMKNTGVYVPDNADDVTSWISRHKVPVAIAVTVVLAFALLSNISDMLYRMHISSMHSGITYNHYHSITSLLGFAALIVGGFFIAKTFSRSKSSSKEKEDAQQ